MRLILQIALIGLASYLATMGPWAQAKTQDALAEQIARLDWDKSDVGIHSSATDSCPIVIVAHYVKPDVVTDTDTGYVSLHPYKFILDKNGRLIGGSGELSEMHSSCRDYTDGWCNGAGNFENVTKNGFDYHLSLDWQKDGKKQETFDERFHCLWLKEQTFKKDGFVITITTKLK